MSLDVECARSEALFVSPVQPSEAVTADQVRTAVTQAVRRHGTRGCAALVAYEFGEHPDTAVRRMRWASATVAATFRRRRAARVPVAACRPQPGLEAA